MQGISFDGGEVQRKSWDVAGSTLPMTPTMGNLGICGNLALFSIPGNYSCPATCHSDWCLIH